MKPLSSLRGVLVAAVIVSGLAAGAVGAAYAGGGEAPQSASTQDPAPPYVPPQTNARGQTFGSALGAMTYAQVPDLVSVWDNEAQMGYALKTDIFPSAFPESPGAATPPRQGDLATRSVPVYTSDGVTVIGTYGAWGQAGSPTPGN